MNELVSVLGRFNAVPERTIPGQPIRPHTIAKDLVVGGLPQVIRSFVIAARALGDQFGYRLEAESARRESHERTP